MSASQRSPETQRSPDTQRSPETQRSRGTRQARRTRRLHQAPLALALGAGLAIAVVVVGGGGRPTGTASAADRAQPTRITHVVEVMLENHTFDSLFGTFPGARGITAGERLANPSAGGPPVAPLLAPPNEGEVEGGLNNSRAAELTMMDARNGRYAMDGYTRYPGEGLASITGFPPSDDPNLQYLARHYELAEENFQPVIAPTLPNVLAAVAGTNEGWTSNDQPPPSLRFSSIFDELAAAHRSAVFYSGVPGWVYTGSVWPRLLPKAETIRPLTAFFSAARSGTLPAFSFVRPGVGYSEEPPEDVGEGDAWLGEVVAAVGRSPEWPSTAVFVTYDEGGGFWDGVSPTVGSGYGTRTPMIVVAPDAKRGLFDSETTNLSVLSYLDHLFGLKPLTPLQARQNDLVGAFDADQAPLPPPSPPVVPPATIGFYAEHSDDVSDPPAMRPGRPLTIQLVEESASTTPVLSDATVTLRLVPPAGVGVPSRFPTSVRLVKGTADLTLALAKPGYYRLRASAPGGVVGWITLDVGVGANTP